MFVRWENNFNSNCLQKIFHPSPVICGLLDKLKKIPWYLENNVKIIWLWNKITLKIMKSGHVTHKPILKEEFKCQKIDDN